MSDEAFMSPGDRTRTIAGRFNEFLRTVPTATQALQMPPEELAERELAASTMAAEIRALARGEGPP